MSKSCAEIVLALRIFFHCDGCAGVSVMLFSLILGMRLPLASVRGVWLGLRFDRIG